MNSIFAYFFTITIFIHPATVLAADYSDFDSFCQKLRQHELELIKAEVEEGLLTKAEAEEEIEYVPTVEQCVCSYQKILEGTGADFTLYMQKRAEIEMMADSMADENFRVKKLTEMEIPKYPEELDIVTFINDIDIACGYDAE